MEDWDSSAEHMTLGTSILMDLRELDARTRGVNVARLRHAVERKTRASKKDAFGEALAAELQKKTMGTGAGSGRKCHNCGRPGHIAAQCRQGQSQGGRRTLCLVCGEEGHTAFACAKANPMARSHLNERGGKQRK